MGNLKIKIKKCGMVRKIDGQKVNGFYGKVISHGTKSFEDIVKMSCKGSTLDFREAELACKMMIDGIVDSIKQGFIVDLGPLGTLYPAVSSKWEEDPKDLALGDMTPRVNYKGSDDIMAAIKGATLSWATEKDEKEGVETPDDDNTQTGGNGGATGGELEG